MIVAMRDEPRISREELRACLRDEYGLLAAAIEFLPLGQDADAGVYRVVSEQGQSYLLKIRAGPVYPPSCVVPRYLCDQGIASVVAPLPTKTEGLWAAAGEWTAVVYNYVEGVTGWTGMTDEHWRLTGAIFKRIHEMAPPAAGFDGLRRESFDPSVYARSVDSTEAQLARRGGGQRASERALVSSWTRHRQRIRALVTFLDKLGGILRRQNLPQVICHADLHPGNLLRDRAGEVFVVDWEDVMSARRERDFIFVEEPSNVSSGGGGAPFFEGYGPTEIDWVALTYYRYERVVQDLIAYAEQVISREDLSEETRGEAVGRFNESLEGRNFYAAQAAAGHLSPDLTVPATGRDDTR